MSDLINLLPEGVFKFLMNLADLARRTFFNVVEYASDDLVTIGSSSFSLIEVFFGGGLTVYIGYSLVKWVLKLF